MEATIRKFSNSSVDWLLLFFTVPLLLMGLLTMSSFGGDNYFFDRQLIWITASLIVFFATSFIDWRFLRRSGMVTGLYFLAIFFLLLLFALGRISNGAQSWFNLFGVSFQPADLMKIAMIFLLAKFFTRRHVEIAHWRHIIVSGLYTLIPFGLVLIQPDFGSALIIFMIWLGMIVVAGVPKRHLVVLLGLGLISFSVAWLFVFHPYQKQRVMTFIDPLADVRGAGYNAYQSKVAFGSGQVLGKGVGFGTQSRLKFLPEYQTDFIFSSFAEEWGFVGVLLAFFLYGAIIWRILKTASLGASNFETLFGVGLAIYLMSHFIVHIGMNIGIMPVTGLPLPFMSYGGSHLMMEFAGLGILMGMRRYNLPYHREDIHNEFVGPQ